VTVPAPRTILLPPPLADLRRDLFAQGVVDHPLFRALENDELDAAGVQRVAIDVFHVVAAFPRFLSALLTNLEDWSLRMELVENLFEEHGRMKPEHVHVVTFQSFLTAIGIPPAVVGASRPGLPALCYTRAMLDLCGRQPAPEAIGALAVVEEIVSRVSPRVAAFGWARSGGAPVGSHFGVHEVVDVTHAEELYAVALRLPAEAQPAVAQGMELGMYYHRRLYDDLLREARRFPIAAVAR
jgi:pyrroloquinoline quinone (PQQ) biosynthesis protein C